jgi:hypothetical protein
MTETSKTVSVKVLKPFVHDQSPQKKDTVLNLNENTARYYENRGFIEIQEPKQKSKDK